MLEKSDRIVEKQFKNFMKSRKEYEQTKDQYL